MMPEALIVYGGWEGHDPEGVSNLLGRVLQASGVEVTRSADLDVFTQMDLNRFDLIVPVWTMESMAKDQLQALLEAVRAGVGIAGFHGIIDSFRHEAEFHLMLGGQWVTHFDFAVRQYQVDMAAETDPITAGLPSLAVTTEQYYLLVDPAIKVLATMQVGGTRMPVAWTKRYAMGRVFYCSLGHDVGVLAQPDVLELCRRGLIWAAGALL
jgi:type 1 glutamine amidotransferase